MRRICALRLPPDLPKRWHLLQRQDFGAASYDDGLRMVATGEAAHYPMLTFAVGALKQNYPEYLESTGRA
jgi:hypothetical protein